MTAHCRSCESALSRQRLAHREMKSPWQHGLFLVARLLGHRGVLLALSRGPSQSRLLNLPVTWRWARAGHRRRDRGEYRSRGFSSSFLATRSKANAAPLAGEELVSAVGEMQSHIVTIVGTERLPRRASAAFVGSGRPRKPFYDSSGPAYGNKRCNLLQAALMLEMLSKSWSETSTVGEMVMRKNQKMRMSISSQNPRSPWLSSIN